MSDEQESIEFYRRRIMFLRRYIEAIRSTYAPGVDTALVDVADLERLCGTAESLALTFERLIPILVQAEAEKRG